MIEKNWTMDVKKTVEEIQQTYAEFTRLSVLIVDNQGRPLVKPSAHQPFFKKLSDPEGEVRERFWEEVRQYAGLTRPALCDLWLPGVKFIIAPFKAPGGDATCYVVAGVLIQQGTKTMLEEEVAHAGLYDEGRKLLLDLVLEAEELSGEEAEVWREKIGKLAEAVERILQSVHRETFIRERLAELRLTLTTARKERASVELTFEQFTDISGTADLMGYAEKTGPGEYRISRISGKDGGGLLDAEFREGEGFLGQAALSESPMQWTDIQRDPRSFFLRQRGIGEIYGLRCFPVRMGGEQLGILFIVAKRKYEVDPLLREFEDVLVALICEYIASGTIEMRMERQIQRLRPLMEVTRFMISAQNTQRILFMLVDMSLSLVWNPSSAIIVHESASGEKVQIVSRGIGNEFAEQYARDVAKRVLRENHMHTPGFELSQTEEGQLMIEYPIVYASKTRGVLAVSLSSEQEAEECREVLLALATMGSIILQSVHDQHQLRLQNDRFLKMMYDSSKRGEEKQGKDTDLSLRLLEEYARYSGITSEESVFLQRASRLSVLDEPARREFGDAFGDEIAVLKEYRSMLDSEGQTGNFSYSREAQLLRTVLYFAALDEDTASRLHLNGVSPEMFNHFRKFMAVRHTVQSEVILSDGSTAAFNPAEAEERGIEAIVKEFGLSKREKEVLELVVRASSNKDIAAKLFISEHTVKNHLTNIFNKMSVSDRAQAIARVFNRGIG
ncbi:LuxR C-terminal-related transcriptional regulator [Saccharibacillus sp. CPCC 101409]|uniref:LuxR C-terminal-related transcriptional regulator n=1 Tax=Saccharibacillus sp. CPCC 101409 TaxID=3058041 RepID=UPI002671EDC0|nr:LuxR C-terminal-related transcriptional regulator [Saccharibacillus sp. CPCC 101409]MDO3410096.1 LuxR C-terminal-related transcriptional regulator [Saccharibacillus sp. CPCC 101409]